METYRPLIAAGLLVFALTACGRTITAPGDAQEPPPAVATVVQEFSAEPIDAGADPDAFAYRVEVVALKGENPCIAANEALSLDQRRDGSTLFLTAMRRTLDPSRICTMEYSPVFETLTAEVRGVRREVDRVLVENVGEMGQQQPLW